MSLFLNVILLYLVGSISFSYLLVKFKTSKDLSAEGSGNLGAKNASRVLGLGGGIGVLLLDALKGYIPLFVLSQKAHSIEQLTLYGLALIIGHNFSAFLRFKGGKGLATGLGVIFYLSPYFAITILLAALSFFIITRNTNIAASLAVFLYPFVYFLIFESVNGLIISVITSFVILIKHKKDILIFIRNFGS